MRRADVCAELLDDVKVELGITWEDEATDRRIRGLIAAATTYLDGKSGTVLNYDEDGLPRTLMMEYVRYARDAALDVFENNYLSMILALQHGKAVDAYLESAEQTK